MEWSDVLNEAIISPPNLACSRLAPGAAKSVKMVCGVGRGG